MNLLLTGAFPYTEKQFGELEELCGNVYFVQDERISLHQQDLSFSLNEIDAVVCNALFLHNDISDFTALRFVQLTSAGFDRVPLNEMKHRDVELHNAKGIYSIPIAEWAVLKLLEIYKHSHFFCKLQANKVWEKQRDVLELTDKVVSVFGLGAVGAEVAKRLQAFGCHVIGVDPFVKSSDYVDELYGVNSAEKVIAKSDVIILTLPLTDETHHFIDQRMLSLMKDDMVLINVSRGAVIDEAALVKKINDGKFLGVALDVFEEEPLPKSSPLWSMENVIITPHNSFISDKVSQRLYAQIYKNLYTYITHINERNF